MKWTRSEGLSALLNAPRNVLTRANADSADYKLARSRRGNPTLAQKGNSAGHTLFALPHRDATTFNVYCNSGKRFVHLDKDVGGGQ